MDVQHLILCHRQKHVHVYSVCKDILPEMWQVGCCCLGNVIPSFDSLSGEETFRSRFTTSQNPSEQTHKHVKLS